MATYVITPGGYHGVGGSSRWFDSCAARHAPVWTSGHDIIGEASQQTVELLMTEAPGG